MVKRRVLMVPVFLVAACLALEAAENLKLNQRLDYTSDSQDGPLITGDHMGDGLESDKPNYVIFFGEG